MRITNQLQLTNQIRITNTNNESMRIGECESRIKTTECEEGMRITNQTTECE